jgi:ketosteroid isomerase-like protein
MSAQDLELVRRGFEAFQRGDRALALGAIDDHFDVVDPVSSDSGFAADHFLEAGERIVVLCRQWGRRRDTGVRVEWRVAIAGTVDGGRITALEYYPSWEEALDGR